MMAVDELSRHLVEGLFLAWQSLKETYQVKSQFWRSFWAFLD
jgi:hypothetical protein